MASPSHLACLSNPRKRDMHEDRQIVPSVKEQEWQQSPERNLSAINYNLNVDLWHLRSCRKHNEYDALLQYNGIVKQESLKITIFGTFFQERRLYQVTTPQDRSRLITTYVPNSSPSKEYTYSERLQCSHHRLMVVSWFFDIHLFRKFPFSCIVDLAGNRVENSLGL